MHFLSCSPLLDIIRPLLASVWEVAGILSGAGESKCFSNVNGDSRVLWMLQRRGGRSRGGTGGESARWEDQRVSFINKSWSWPGVKLFRDHLWNVVLNPGAFPIHLDLFALNVLHFVWTVSLGVSLPIYSHLIAGSDDEIFFGRNSRWERLGYLKMGNNGLHPRPGHLQSAHYVPWPWKSERATGTRGSIP